MPTDSISRHPDALPIGVDSGSVMTVLGALPVHRMGVTLMHEHILLDATGKWVPPCSCAGRLAAEKPISMDMLGELRMDPLANRDNCEELMKFRELGGETVVDPTNIGIGRDPQALQRISRRTGLNIVMGTGFYLEPSHPRYVARSSVEALTEQLVFEVGAAPSKPPVIAGFIGEIGVSADFTPNEEKSLRAAARAAGRARVSLQVHLPGWHRLGHGVLDIVEEEGADLRHTVLCHMNPSMYDKDYQRSLAQRGAFIEYDMIGLDCYFPGEQAQAPSDEENVRAIRALIDDGHIDRLLLSQDVFLKGMLTRYGGHGYGYLLRHFLPRLRRNGLTGEQLETLMVDNPRKVFAAATRPPTV
jgi:phosphotriesterase-related protein